MAEILLIEDDKAVTRALATLLRDAGYRVTVSHTAADAMAHVQQSRPAAVLVDIHLPDLNGLVLCQKIRERLGPDVSIVIMSGDTAMENINALPFVGASYFLAKPVNPAYLIERLGEWTRGKVQA